MLNYGDLIKRLSEKGSRVSTDKVSEVLAERKENPTPWAVKLLITLGALLAAIFLSAFLIIFLEDLYVVSFIVLGVLATVIKNRAHKQDEPSIFSEQFALAAGLGSQFCCLLWFVDNFHSITAVVFGITFVEVLFFLFFNDKIQRFLSVLFIYTAMLILSLELKAVNAGYILANISSILALSLIWLNEESDMIQEKRDLFIPAAYAFASLLLLMPLVSISTLVGEVLDEKVILLWPGSAALCGSLIYLAFRICRSLKFKPNGTAFYLIIALVCVLALLTRNTPGIMASLFILTIGYFRNNAILTGVSIIILICYVMQFYYFMDVTLLAKSIILMGTGAVMLIFLLSLNRIWRQQEDVSI